MLSARRKQRAVCRRAINHMGSAMTSSLFTGAKVMQALEHYTLFLDSMTIAQPRCARHPVRV
ncbi:hypothetical protein KCP73_13205 [Salmonella enterica subsp. enterica]|nr:hypothetical protein KCP73_13205 [Salmonella enterica subsp. enterica]